jgi:predicted GIY-YIG superfamily endonuclease
MKHLKNFNEINEGKKIWTKEKCQEEALKYSSRSEFRKLSERAYNSSRLNGWLDEVCSHMIPLRNFKGYWTKERCQEIALKYNSRSEFGNNEPTAYSIARIRGWLKEVCDHMSYLGNRVKRFVYIYTFPDNAVYIGLTSDFKRRNIQHTLENSRKSSVYDYIKLTGLIPTSKLLTPEPIPLDDAVKMEINLIKEYRDRNYKVLNTSNGGDVGGNYLIWTKEKCKEEALKYKNKIDFTKGSPGAIAAAYKYGWIDEICKDYDKVIRDFYWTKERCREEALKYDKRYKFKLGSRGAQSSAYKNGWLDEICAHMDKQTNPAGSWTKERCREEALKYNNLNDFKTSAGGAAAAAQRNGWIDEICSHMEIRDIKPRGYWTKERCREEALKYNTRSSYIKGSPSGQVAGRNGWMDEICSHMIVKKRPVGYWTKERCQEEALKYNTRNDFIKGCSGAQVAQKLGWMDEICSHMIKK